MQVQQIRLYSQTTASEKCKNEFRFLFFSTFPSCCLDGHIGEWRGRSYSSNMREILTLPSVYGHAHTRVNMPRYGFKRKIHILSQGGRYFSETFVGKSGPTRYKTACMYFVCYAPMDLCSMLTAVVLYLRLHPHQRSLCITCSFMFIILYITEQLLFMSAKMPWMRK